MIHSGKKKQLKIKENHFTKLSESEKILKFIENQNQKKMLIINIKA